MAGLDLAAGAVGIASFGIQVCQGLLSYYDGFKDFKSDILTTRNAVADLDRSLTLLKSSLDHGGLDKERTEQVQMCLASCRQGLDELSKKARELKTHDAPHGLRQHVQAKLQHVSYPLRKETLAKLRENVGEIRGCLQLAIATLQLHMNQQMLTIKKSDRWRTIVNSLSSPDPWENFHTVRQQREPNTGTWLLQCQQYQEWKSGLTRRVWMHGKVGCGKSVLCATAIEDMEAHCQATANATLAIFYFTFSDDRKQTYEHLIQSLVVQLGWKEPALSMLQKACDRSDRRSPGPNELEDIVLSAITAHGDVFLLLDAIDECPETNEARENLFERLGRLIQRAPNLQIFATSRELPDIRDSMSALQVDTIDIAAQNVDADIRRYVSNQLQNSPKLSKLNAEMKALIQEELVRKSDGMFRWVVCQMRVLKRLPSFVPKHVRKALMNLPRTLDETYERMLTSIDDDYREDAQKLLRWLAYAQSPPTLEELVEALIIYPETNHVDREERGGLEDSLNILSGLVVTIKTGEDRNADDPIDDGDPDTKDNGIYATLAYWQDEDVKTQVRLAHFSVQEYLESTRILEGSARMFHFEPSREHRFLAQSCITYLMHYSGSSDKTSTSEDLDTFPLAKYAARSWYYHSAFRDADIERATTFLDSVQYRQDLLFLHSPEYQGGEALRYGPMENPASGLYLASLTGLIEVTRQLLKQGAAVNTQGGDFGNALQATSLEGHIEIVKLLLENGADVNAKGGEYGNALQATSLDGHIETVKLLLENGADINARGGKYGNALQATSLEGHIEIVKLLIEKGADVNALGGEYGNALTAASSEGHSEIVKLLLEKGADVNALGGTLGTALATASNGGHIEIVKLLLEQGADVNARGEYGGALTVASNKGDNAIVELLLEKGANINALGGPIGTALETASGRGHTETVKLLLGKGADVNHHEGPYGDALTVATIYGDREIVELLLEKGADINPGGAYDTILTTALLNWHTDIAKLLIEKGTHIDGAALAIASSGGDSEIVRLLLEKGADVNAQKAPFGAALVAASSGGHIEIVELLLENGADVDAQGDNVDPAVVAAASEGHSEIVELLLEKGADANAQGGHHGNALKAAISRGDSKTVELLLAYSAQPFEERSDESN